eukprot:365940-Chlamydomonas_euryale.AAC.38
MADQSGSFGRSYQHMYPAHVFHLRCHCALRPTTSPPLAFKRAPVYIPLAVKRVPVYNPLAVKRVPVYNPIAVKRVPVYNPLAVKQVPVYNPSLLSPASSPPLLRPTYSPPQTSPASSPPLISATARAALPAARPQMQLIVSTAAMTPAAYLAAALLLPAEFTLPVAGSPEPQRVAAWHVFVTVAVGLWGGLLIGLQTEYFTSYRYRPVQDVADACRTGAATNVIFGLALGYQVRASGRMCAPNPGTPQPGEYGG